MCIRDRYQDLKEFSSLPDIIRGYEEVRLDTMTEYYKKSDNLFKAKKSISIYSYTNYI